MESDRRICEMPADPFSKACACCGGRRWRMTTLRALDGSVELDLLKCLDCGALDDLRTHARRNFA